MQNFAGSTVSVVSIHSSGSQDFWDQPSLSTVRYPKKNHEGRISAGGLAGCLFDLS